MRVEKFTVGLEKRYKVYTALSPIFMLGEVLMETTIPLVMAKIVDEGIASKNLPLVLRLGAIMALMSIVSLCFGVACGRFSSIAAFGFSRNLRRLLFEAVQQFSFCSSEKFGTGSLVTRLTTDVTNVQNLYQNIVRSCVRAPLMLILGIFMASSINSRLSLIFFAAVPPLAFLLIFINRVAYPRFCAMFKQYDEMNVMVQENLSAIRTVKAFVREDFESERFSKIADSLRRAQQNAEKIVVLSSPLMQFVVYLCIASALWFGGSMILSEEMSVGGLISFLSYISRVLMSLMMLGMIFVQVVLSRASILRISELLDEPIEDAGGTETTLSDGSVEFLDVDFEYTKNRPVLSKINLKIESGEFVGILGGTGSAKSTLIRLIPRFLDVANGIVRVGGKNVRDYDIRALRKEIAFVPQKSELFSGTIQENLFWGKENATNQELVESCTIAAADDFVRAFPNGYNEKIGQGGVTLSGGQRQRLCIARAILKKPKILILDDSLSAVDASTERKIRASLQNSDFLSKTTKIIIAQRIKSVLAADRIIVLDDGKIAGVGTHDFLLSSCSVYRELYASQKEDDGNE